MSSARCLVDHVQVILASPLRPIPAIFALTLLFRLLADLLTLLIVRRFGSAGLFLCRARSP